MAFENIQQLVISNIAHQDLLLLTFKDFARLPCLYSYALMEIDAPRCSPCIKKYSASFLNSRVRFMLLFFWQYKAMSKFIHIFTGKSMTALLAPFLKVLMDGVRNEHLPWELQLRGGVEINQASTPPLTQTVWPVCCLFR